MVAGAVSALFVAGGVEQSVGAGAAVRSGVGVVALELAFVPVAEDVAEHGESAPPAECAVDEVAQQCCDLLLVRPP